MKKLAILTVALALVVCVTVYATVAFFTDTAEVNNTFTVGKVQITLDEEDITKGDGSRTTVGNDYHLVPGRSYVKDPTITVLPGSENSYVRMMVTINRIYELTQMLGGDPFETGFFTELNTTNWKLHGTIDNTAENSRTYEFRYNKTVSSGELEPLFTGFTVPGHLTAAGLNTLIDGNANRGEEFQIKIVGHAIQTTGLGSEDAAWSTFDRQHNYTSPTAAATATPDVTPSPTPYVTGGETT